MGYLPPYILLTFICAVLLTAFFFYKATLSITLLLCFTSWLMLQALIGISGFYTNTDIIPPRFLLLVIPPFVWILLLFITRKGRAFVTQLDLKWLTLLHVVRLPVEIVLFWLSREGKVPDIMTFEGRNFDILPGITAPLVYYFGFVKQKLSSQFMLLWNFLSLGLLMNIVVTAVFSAPFPFQQWGFDQPNIAVLYFPYLLLPGFIVPIVLLSHLVAIKQLYQGKIKKG